MFEVSCPSSGQVQTDPAHPSFPSLLPLPKLCLFLPSLSFCIVPSPKSRMLDMLGKGPQSTDIRAGEVVETTSRLPVHGM